MSATVGTPLVVFDIGGQTATMTPGSPNRILAQANENCLKVSVFQGEGNWHRHPKTDEIFVVLEGEMFLDVFEGETVSVRPQQVVTVPAGVVHRPRSDVRSTILCFKPMVSETEYYELETETPTTSDGHA